MSIENLLIKPNTENKDIISQCCDCRKFALTTGDYLAIPKQVEERLYNIYLVSHGYCPDCLTILSKKGWYNHALKENKRKEL